MNYKKVLLFVLLGQSLISCSKGGADNSNTQEQAMKNLTDKYFIRTDAVSDPAYPIGNGTSSTDLYHDWYKDQCILDDLRMFKSNGDFIYDNGATKCDTSEAQTATLKWRFIENNSKIEVTQTPYKDTLTILVNDGTILKYQKKAKDFSGNSPVYIWTETWHVK